MQLVQGMQQILIFLQSDSWVPDPQCSHFKEWFSTYPICLFGEYYMDWSRLTNFDDKVSSDSKQLVPKYTWRNQALGETSLRSKPCSNGPVQNQSIVLCQLYTRMDNCWRNFWICVYLICGTCSMFSYTQLLQYCHLKLLVSLVCFDGVSNNFEGVKKVLMPWLTHFSDPPPTTVIMNGPLNVDST